MGGPSAGVLFAKSTALNWQKVIDDVISSIGSVDADGTVMVSTTLAVGGSYVGMGRPFSIGSGIDEQLTVEELLADCGSLSIRYEADFGVRPDSEVVLNAFAKGSDDHRILAEVALALARRLGGIIDMRGLIVPRSTYTSPQLLGRAFEELDWSDVKLGVEAFTDAMPGIAIAHPYLVTAGREWASHSVDTTFLEAWLRHPEFHMIK